MALPCSDRTSPVSAKTLRKAVASPASDSKPLCADGAARIALACDER